MDRAGEVSFGAAEGFALALPFGLFRGAWVAGAVLLWPLTAALLARRSGVEGSCSRPQASELRLVRNRAGGLAIASWRMIG